MKEIDRRLRNTEGLLRHLIVRVDEHERKAERAKTIRVEDSRRRRVARGLPPDRQPGEGPQAQDGDDDDRDGFDRDGGIGIMAFAKKSGPAGKGRGRGAKATGDKKDGQRRGMFRRRKVCKFCAERVDDINYKDMRMLSRLRAGARQGAAAPHLGHLRAAPAQAPHGHHAGAPDCAPALRDRVGGSMEIILRDHVEHLGTRGQIVKVADGYARNYLLPRKLALLATEANKKRVERERKIAEAREAEERSSSEAIATRLSALDLTFTRKVGETGHLFGSVTSQDIADAVKAKGFDVDKRKILLPDAIKALGEFTVPVKLHRDVTAQLKVTITKE